MRHSNSRFGSWSARPQVATPARFSGSTLTEVLVALLIMSIGLVSLATLFPLATMRAAKAVQVTAATDLRYNAESTLKLYPRMIADPDLNINTTNLPSENPPNNEPAPQYKLWVIDPLGWNAANEMTNKKDANNNNYADFFGQDGSNNNVAWTRVQRFHFGRNTPALANEFATLPDSSTLLYEGRNITLQKTPAAANGFTRAVVPGILNAGITVDGNGRPNPAARIVLFSADGRSSQVRDITKIDTATETVFWSEDLNGDDSLQPVEDINLNGIVDHRIVSLNFSALTARIETPDQRYTYLLTMRKTEVGLAEVDVVVFFKRQAITAATDPRNDERLFVVSDGNNAPKKEKGFVAGSSKITVKFTSPIKPAFRKGSFVFDAGNARWYRVVNVDSVDDTKGEAVLSIDPPAILSSPRDDNGKLVGNLAMFPRGIVDVFPLGTKP